ncbi:amino acid--[acyl-carrier-protein] ligase [Paraburkholderia sp. IMGN_8]|uniref:amino acid--[acyl-carrier-protein] ligase n=1 Tax=Paraburkholderia sp. IMGN_8 TaxID=3136564 RepID=UPI0031016807
MLNRAEDITKAEIGSDGLGDFPAAPRPRDSLSFLEALLASGLLISTGVEGVYGRSAVFEEVVARVNAMVGVWGAGKHVEMLRFPPAMNRKVLEASGFWQNCPEQIGTVFSFCGDDRDHQRLLKCLDNRDDWAEELKPSRLSMTPAACYPVYSIIAARGPLPEAGRIVDILSYCFRHEPSIDPARMQMFRQREFVRMGTADQVQDFRKQLMEHASGMMRALRLPATVEVANDPFFGRAGKIVADIQRRQELKYELLIPGINAEKPTACASFNYHLDRFGEVWKITTDAGQVAHTGCVGFGLERIALSLFKHHGLEAQGWPDDVRAALWVEEKRATAAPRSVVR